MGGGEAADREHVGRGWLLQSIQPYIWTSEVSSAHEDPSELKLDPTYTETLLTEICRSLIPLQPRWLVTPNRSLHRCLVRSPWAAISSSLGSNSSSVGAQASPLLGSGSLQPQFGRFWAAVRRLQRFWASTAVRQS